MRVSLRRVSVYALLALAIVVPSAFSQTSLFETNVKHAITADVLWLFKGDFQFEYAQTVSAHSSWSVRAGITKHRAGQGEIGEEYANGNYRFYLGFRYRYYFAFRAPHLVFISAGVDNRPWDNMVAPVVNAGVSFNLKPVTVSVLYALGYEIYVRDRSLDGWHSRWVYGPEIRAGVCF